MELKPRFLFLSVLGLFVFLYLLPLGSRPLFGPDEMRYAEIPREMLSSGDWVVPRLNGLLYFEKPVLGYWLTGASMLLFGENGFAVRLPSALAAGLSALLVFFLARGEGRSGEQSTGALAALVFLTCFEVVGIGTFAVLDTMLALFLSGAMFFFYRALSARPGSRRESGMLAGAGICCGLAFLTKGFLAFATPALTVGGYLLWQGRGRDLLRVAWLPLAAATLVSLPWAMAIHWREPDFWPFFFWNEHVRRFLGNNAQHRQSFWFFFIAAPAMFLPWTFAVPAALAGLKASSRQSGAGSNLTRFALCWLALPFLFVSVSKGKLLTYILPCCPPFALLMAQGLANCRRESDCRRFRWGAFTAALFSGLLLALLLGAQFGGFEGFRLYSQPWMWLLMAVSLSLTTALFVLAARSRLMPVRPFLFGLAPVPLLFSLPLAMPDLTLEMKAPASFLERHLPDVGPTTTILSDEDPVQAVCLAFKREDVILVEESGELGYGVKREKARTCQLTVEQAGEMIRGNRGRIVLVARQKKYNRWKKLLPAPTVLDTNGKKGYVFARY